MATVQPLLEREEGQEVVKKHNFVDCIFDGCMYGLIALYGEKKGMPIRKPWRAPCVNKCLPGFLVIPAAFKAVAAVAKCIPVAAPDGLIRTAGQSFGFAVIHGAKAISPEQQKAPTLRRGLSDSTEAESF